MQTFYNMEKIVANTKTRFFKDGHFFESVNGRKVYYKNIFTYSVKFSYPYPRDYRIARLTDEGKIDNHSYHDFVFSSPKQVAKFAKKVSQGMKIVSLSVSDGPVKHFHIEVISNFNTRHYKFVDNLLAENTRLDFFKKLVGYEENTEQKLFVWYSM